MKLIFTLFVGVFFSLAASGHGKIEKIDCMNGASGSKMESEKITDDMKADVKFTKAGQSQTIAKGAKMSLEDKVKDGAVYENITFPVDGGSADLLIKEDYSKKVRSGEGSVKSAKLKLDESFECAVEYK